MKTFDSPALSALIARKAKLNRLNEIFFIILLVITVTVAALSGQARNNLQLYIIALCVCAALLVAFLLFNILCVARVGNRLKAAVAAEIAEGVLTEEDMLKGEGAIELSVDYDDGKIILSRKDFKKQVAVTKQGLVPYAGGNVVFDLTALRRVPSAYSSVGLYLWAFLQAYFRLNAAALKVSDVAVDDNLAKKPTMLILVKDGEYVGGNEKNYFIQKEILK